MAEIQTAHQKPDTNFSSFISGDKRAHVSNYKTFSPVPQRQHSTLKTGCHILDFQQVRINFADFRADFLGNFLLLIHRQIQKRPHQVPVNDAPGRIRVDSMIRFDCPK